MAPLGGGPAFRRVLSRACATAAGPQPNRLADVVATGYCPSVCEAPCMI